jgi:Calcineurin-like phosphoesterase
MRRLAEAFPRGLGRTAMRLLPVLALGWLPATGLADDAMPAWVQLVGPGAAPTIRVITTAASCPALNADGEDIAMQVRADPQPLFRTKESKLPPAKFPVTVCAATLKPGTKRAVLDGNRTLPLLRDAINRIVVIGDTGCRVEDIKNRQPCDPKGWPYAALARRAADTAPDLVIHVGDYLYRESCTGAACPTTGYGWDVWQADFFAPSTPLMAAAPWIMARGNHEICSRAAEGFFRFLDGPLPGATCPKMSSAYVAGLPEMGFVVVDSSVVPQEQKKDKGAAQKPDRQELSKTYDAMSDPVPDTAWLVTHAPFNGLRVGKSSGVKFDNTILQKALGDRLQPGIKMIVSGHIHLFEALSFSDGRLPQLVVGSAGTELTAAPDGFKGLPVNASDSVVLPKFGFMAWERDARDRTVWNGRLVDETGKDIAVCRLDDTGLACRKASSRTAAPANQ